MFIQCDWCVRFKDSFRLFWLAKLERFTFVDIQKSFEKYQILSNTYKDKQTETELIISSKHS